MLASPTDSHKHTHTRAHAHTHTWTHQIKHLFVYCISSACYRYQRGFTREAKGTVLFNAAHLNFLHFQRYLQFKHHRLVLVVLQQWHLPTMYPAEIEKD